jgi:ABC-type glycerol-3-phosphate transport system substrate-binding protein
MRKHKRLLISLLLVLALLVTACGNGNSGSGSSSNAADKQSGNSSGSGEETITLRIISVSQTENPDGPAELAMAEEYMKQNPNIKIEFIGVPMNDLYKKLTTLATSNDLPDAFTMTPQFMRTAKDMGMLANMNELLGEEYLKEFYPNVLEEASVDGELQFLPWVATPLALIYRGDWFEEEGLEAPETWDEFLEVARKMTKDTDGDGQIDRWGYGMVGTRNGSGADRFMAKLRTFGVAEIREENGQWVTDLNTDKAKEAFKFLTDLNNVHGVIPPGVTETGFPEAATLMATGKVAMMITGPNALGNIYSQNPDLKGKIYSTPIPKAENHAATFGLLGYAVSATSQHKEEVVKYLKFMVNKENALKWNELSGRLPTKIEVGQDQQLTGPDYAGYVKALEYAYLTPSFSQYSQFQDIVAEAYQLILTGAATVDEAAENAADRAMKVINMAGN